MCLSEAFTSWEYTSKVEEPPTHWLVTLTLTLSLT